MHGTVLLRRLQLNLLVVLPRILLICRGSGGIFDFILGGLHDLLGLLLPQVFPLDIPASLG